MAGPQVCPPGLGGETYLFTTNQFHNQVYKPATQWLGTRSVAQGWEGRLTYLTPTNILFDPQVLTELAYLGTMVYLYHSGQDEALLHSIDILFTTNK